MECMRTHMKSMVKLHGMHYNRYGISGEALQFHAEFMGNPLESIWYYSYTTQWHPLESI